jgi:hypothetical protein
LLAITTGFFFRVHFCQTLNRLPQEPNSGHPCQICGSTGQSEFARTDNDYKETERETWVHYLNTVQRAS